jgi:pyridoxamine 5'-phosphate oxidase family protein
MIFTDDEIAYLRAQRLGRLATLKPNGELQNSPVSFGYHEPTGTIDIGGYRMAASRKFRNVAVNGRVAFVVDDVVSVQPWQVRCLEIRGRAEALTEVNLPDNHFDDAVIRIHPERILAFGVEDWDREPLELETNIRNG